MWGNFWLRSLMTIGLFTGITVMATRLSLFLVVQLFTTHTGVLDFAGGAVVHVSLLGPLVFACLVWTASEIIAWRSGKLMPLGSLLLFSASFAALAPTIAMLTIGTFAQGHVHSYFVILLVAAFVIALIPAWLYACIRRKVNATSRTAAP